MSIAKRKRLVVAALVLGLLACSTSIWVPDLLREANPLWVKDNYPNDIIDALSLLGILVVALAVIDYYRHGRVASNGEMPEANAETPESPAEQMAVAGSDATPV